MRVNSRVLTERSDLLGEIQIPNCPSQFKKVAENLMTMLTTPGYAVPDYHTMSELDKILMLEYWNKFDDMNTVIHENKFLSWYVEKATSPELIRRARQWLCERNYVFPKSDVSERAYEAGDSFRKSVRH